MSLCFYPISYHYIQYSYDQSYRTFELHGTKYQLINQIVPGQQIIGFTLLDVARLYKTETYVCHGRAYVTVFIDYKRFFFSQKQYLNKFPFTVFDLHEGMYHSFIKLKLICAMVDSMTQFSSIKNDFFLAKNNI